MRSKYLHYIAKLIQTIAIRFISSINFLEPMLALYLNKINPRLLLITYYQQFDDLSLGDEIVNL